MSDIVSDSAEGEENITGDQPVKGGPTAILHSELSDHSSKQVAPTGKLDSETISKISQAETEITGTAHPLKGGPTAQAQKHAGEPIDAENLRDITEGEKKITGGKRIKGGPTAIAQSELSKARSNN